MKISKTDALILGMLLDESMSPYDMVSHAETINPDYWISIAKPTFYVNVQRLAKKGLIIGETTKHGKMPEKTIYTLTDTGRDTITTALLGFLDSNKMDPEMFRLVIFFLPFLPITRKDLYPYFLYRVGHLEALQKSLEQKFEVIRTKAPLNISIISEYTLRILKQEIAIAQKYYEIIASYENWEGFISLHLTDLKDY